MQGSVAEIRKTGKNGESERASEHRERVEPDDNAGAEEGRDENADQQIVFRVLPTFETVGLDASFPALGFGFEAAKEVIERAHGADPSAEKPAEEKGGYKNDQAPNQAVIESAARECIADAYQRVDQKKEPHRRSEVQVLSGTGRRHAKVRPQQQEQKIEKKKDLRGGAEPCCGRQFHS